MDKIRAEIDGEYKYGYGFQDSEGEHWLIPLGTNTTRYVGLTSQNDRYEIYNVLKFDPAKAAVDTGKDDKNGERIYGSKKPLFQDGDRVGIKMHTGKLAEANVLYDTDALTWVANFDKITQYPLSSWLSDELEIIPKTQEKE